MFFECNSTRYCESFPGGPPPTYVGLPVMKLRQSEVSPEQAWKYAIEVYSSAKLTNIADKYVAIAGIARKIKETTDDEYLAGLWRRDFERQLCWSNTGARVVRPQAPRSPSWSWLAIDEEVGTELFSIHDEAQRTIPLVHVHDVEVVLENVDQPMGSVKSAVLSVRGKVKKAKWRIEEGYGEGDFRRYQIIISDLPAHLLRADDDDSHFFHRPDFLPSARELRIEIFTLPTNINQHSRGRDGVQGLVLMRSRRRRNEYVRLGCFFCSDAIGACLLSQALVTSRATDVQEVSDHRPLPKTARPLRPYDSQDTALLQEAKEARMRRFSPIVSRWVTSQRVTNLIGIEEGFEEAELPFAFTEQDDESAMAIEAEEEAAEEWRVWEVFDGLGLGSPYAAGQEAIPSKIIHIV